jgi:DNA-directed RNA polymerase sigma subunit (sigma70/sigma32)
MVETINKLLRTQRRLTQELNREPTNEEIAAAMEIEVDKVEHIMKIKQDISSLDANVAMTTTILFLVILLRNECASRRSKTTQRKSK